MNDLIKLFSKLVSIPSPSGREQMVGKFIKKHLEKISVKSRFDDVGNLTAIIEGNKDLPTILFVAHMDTVEEGSVPIRAIVSKNVIRSNNKTILGADNKASVACLLEGLKEMSKWREKPTIIAVFSTSEEEGKMGILSIKLPKKIDFAFNLDGQGRIGEFVYKSLGQIPFQIEIFGKEAHASIEPEKGVNAIKIVAEIISKIKLGKDSRGNTVNIGKIYGGKAINIVPGEVFIEGEVRGFASDGLQNKLIKIEKIIKDTCDKEGGTYKFVRKEEEGAPPMYLSKKHTLIQIAERASGKLNLPFSLKKGSFTSEANYLIQKYPVLIVCRGGKMPHSKEESITVRELFLLKSLITELVKTCFI